MRSRMPYAPYGTAEPSKRGQTGAGMRCQRLHNAVTGA